jgi:hypothetical protein
MGAAASVIVAISIVILIYAALMKRKASRITNAQHMQTGAVSRASDGTAVSVQGRPVAQPLVSPVTGTPCLYYELQVEGFWKEGETKKSKTYLETREGQVGVDDGTGVAPLNLAGGGDFDLRQTFKETKKEGFFDDLKNALGAKKPIVFGNFAFENPVNSQANEFTCTEKVFSPQGSVYAAGYVKDGALSRKGLFSLLVSDKTRDEILAAATGSAKKAFLGGAIGVGAGVILGVISMFV